MGVSSKGDDEKKLWSEIAIVTKQIKLLGYSWTQEKKRCRKLLAEETESIHDRISTELSAGKVMEKTCVEDPAKMCPEGNYATTSRRWYPVRGAAAWGTVALISKFTLLPASVAVGGALGGPAGATAGFAVGSVASPLLGAAVGFWASRGKQECACFPRSCSFSQSSGKCQLETHDMVSKNPFSTVLPMHGMKCAVSYKKEDVCSLQQCAHADYKPAIVGKKVFGTIGRQGVALHNCVSLNGRETGSLARASQLANGQNNTIEERNKIYVSLLGDLSIDER